MLSLFLPKLSLIQPWPASLPPPYTVVTAMKPVWFKLLCFAIDRFMVDTWICPHPGNLKISVSNSSYMNFCQSLASDIWWIGFNVSLTKGLMNLLTCTKICSEVRSLLMVTHRPVSHTLCIHPCLQICSDFTILNSTPIYPTAYCLFSGST